MDPAQTASGKIPKAKAGIEWNFKVITFYNLILMLALTIQRGWSTDHRRSLLSLRHCRSGMPSVQHLS